MGSICTLLLVVFLIIATAYKVTLLEGKRAIDIISAVEENHYDQSYIFGAEQGLFVSAAVLSAFDTNTHSSIDPSYGRIRFRRKKWSFDSQGNFFDIVTELESHDCT